MKPSPLRLGKVIPRSPIEHLWPKQEILTTEELNHHVHVVGASGFGKTVLITHIIRHKIKSGDGLLFIDLKNDQDTTSQLREFIRVCGREKDFLEFSLSESQGEAFAGRLESPLRDDSVSDFIEVHHWIS